MGEVSTGTYVPPAPVRTQAAPPPPPEQHATPPNPSIEERAAAIRTVGQTGNSDKPHVGKQLPPDIKGKDADYVINFGSIPERRVIDSSVIEKYTYSPGRFPSKDAYLDHLAENLTGTSEFNVFFDHMYEYSLERETHRVVPENTGAWDGDFLARPADFATEYNERGKIYGDCDEVSGFLDDILSRQKQNGSDITHMNVASSDHALALWYRHNSDGTYTCFLGESGSIKTDVREVTGLPGQSPEEIFTEHFNLDPSHMRASFTFDDGRYYDIPANFSLACRRDEMTAVLGRGDIGGALEIIEEELAKEPGNLSLNFARLQFLALTCAPEEEVNAQADAVAGLLDPDMLGDLMFANFTEETSRFLIEKGFDQAGIGLMQSAENMIAGTGGHLFRGVASAFYLHMADLPGADKDECYRKALEHDSVLLLSIEPRAEQPSDKENMAQMLKQSIEDGSYLSNARKLGVFRSAVSRMSSDKEYNSYIMGRRGELPEEFLAVIGEGL